MLLDGKMNKKTKCKACGNTYPVPDVVEGVAYFVCAHCGNSFDEKDYAVVSEKEAIKLFEEMHGLLLPSRLSEYWELSGDWVVKLPPCTSKRMEYFFGDGFLCLNSGVSDHNSLHDSPALVEEWDLPLEIVLLEGDGHTWLALDYRKRRDEPEVIVIESEERGSLIIASSFSEFMDSLIPYDTVYDSDGTIICQK